MYVLDSNVFIEAKNKHYGFDFAPGSWDWIEAEHNEGVLCSIAEVKREIDDKQDELTTRAAAHRNLFRATDASVQSSLQRVAAWANSRLLYPSCGQHIPRRGRLALHRSPTHMHIKTQSSLMRARTLRPGGGSSSRMRCAAFGVDCINTWEMLRAEGVQFVLAP